MDAFALVSLAKTWTLVGPALLYESPKTSVNAKFNPGSSVKELYV